MVEMMEMKEEVVSVGVPGVSEPGIRITFNSELHFVIPN